MDRQKSRENNQNININKVVDKIGLPDRIQYDKIDVFIDANNRDSVWAIVNYIEDRRGKSVPRKKIVQFKDYREMIQFLQSHFDTYELNNKVDYIHRKIFLHNVDYNCLKYYLHDGNPDKNYIEIEYKEYINDGFHTRKRNLPKEYENMLIDKIKINKNLNKNAKLNWDLYQTIDVNAQKEKNNSERLPRGVRREEREKKEFPMDPNMGKRKVGIKGLAIISTGVLIVAMTTGYVIDRNKKYKKTVVIQKHASIFGKDAEISRNKEKASVIINDLFDGNYSSVSVDDLNLTKDFIYQVGQSNFDRNASSTFFEYNDFFSIKFYENNGYGIQDAAKVTGILEKIEELFSNCFKQVGGELIFNEKAAERYIDYVASLTFMYNTTIGSEISNQNTYYRYADQEEIMVYDKCPPILKYMILSQLKSVLSHTNYQTTINPSNYFAGLDKYGLLNSITERMDNLWLFMKNQCYDAPKKGI